jgi:hypothetical protein
MFAKKQDAVDDSDSEGTKQLKRDRRNEKARKKREKANLKKYRPKLPNKVVVIKNEDKGSWVESWEQPRNRNIACIPHSFRLVASGSVGRGKTNILLNLFLAHQASSRPFKELYVCCCSLESKEWLKAEPTSIMTELPDPEMFNGKKKTLLVIDDFEFEKSNKQTMRTLSTLFRFTSTHKNLSIMCSYQVFFAIPSVARKCASHFIIYKPNSTLEMNTIANRIGMAADDLQYIFREICTGRFDNLMVDMTPDCKPDLKYRKNIYEPIVLAEDSE